MKSKKKIRAAAVTILRSGAGIHADQNRRKSAKALRRDKSYKEHR